MIFHNAVYLLHPAGGGTYSGNKNDIQTRLSFKARHKEAVSLPNHPAGTVACVSFSYLCSGGYPYPVYTEAVFGNIGDQNRTHQGFFMIKPFELMIFSYGYYLSSQLLLPLFSFCCLQQNRKKGHTGNRCDLMIST